MLLVDRLRQGDKKEYFEKTPTAVSYPTGFPTIDYRNGYLLNSYSDSDNLIQSQPNVGIVGGSFNMIIGKSATAKTTGAVQMAYNIISQYDNGLVYHVDVENSTSYTRVRNITGMSNTDLRRKYILKSDSVYIEDIYETILEICNVKLDNPKDYEYNTGMLDEFGEDIIQFIPTVVIIDSIPSMTLRATEGKDEMVTESHGMRKARSMAEFYRTLTPIIRQANVIVIAINHITEKIEMSSFIPTQAQSMYLKMNERLPGGAAPIYYSNNIFKFISNAKYTEEKDGFDGFNIKCELIKSRTNKGGQFANLVYDQEYGFSYARTMLAYLIDNKLVTGRNPHRRIVGYEDYKFSTKTFPEKLSKDPKLNEIVINVAKPHLMGLLSTGEDTKRKADQFEIIKSVGAKIMEEEETHIPIPRKDEAEE